MAVAGHQLRRRSSSPASPTRRKWTRAHASASQRKQWPNWTSSVLWALVALAPLLILMYLEVCRVGEVAYLQFHPSPDQLPATLALRRVNHRETLGSDCHNYGVGDDIYFPRFQGEHCGLSEFEASPGHGGLFPVLHKLQFVTKTFANEQAAHDYYWRFWGRHAYEPVPYRLMSDVTLATPGIGMEPHVLLWDPVLYGVSDAQGLGVDLPANSRAKHVMYIFRSGRTFVKVTASGPEHQLAVALTPELVSELAHVVHLNIQMHDAQSWARAYRACSTQLRARVRASMSSVGRQVEQTWRNQTAKMSASVAAANWSWPRGLTLEAWQSNASSTASFRDIFFDQSQGLSSPPEATHDATALVVADAMDEDAGRNFSDQQMRPPYDLQPLHAVTRSYSQLARLNAFLQNSPQLGFWEFITHVLLLAAVCGLAWASVSLEAPKNRLADARMLRASA
ncbi:uncharacterized protein MONBRDRAFT_33062 [Monosiga brevicollis MX1]|uniref:Uncharacterized protein n=1 Tax=Monosiga brevicollis TaxID=81824 RepID=A9V3A7_MONBE|nr:uncharacterized protein MONBRDRAFT_33062 [Monosiga brevicollis MX1]EDQ88027.1 predicted protein [Monosiga brevicollis MX1]|eukprot:XP_001747103.1 hypothetical protein [Monosiga brevicollis MX1]